MKEVRFTDNSGKKHIGELLECLQCGKEFKAIRHKGRRYCGRKCFFQSTKTSVEVRCSTCNKIKEISPSKFAKSKSGHFFCNRQCKAVAQSLKGGIKEIQPSHYGKGPENYRSLFSKDELVCSRCGYSEFSGSVDIHHIDEDRNNNERDNLIPLCACCHRGLHHGHWNLEEGVG